MKYLIHGFYGAGNAGDDAILHALIDQLVGIEPDAEITVSVRSKSIGAYYGSHPVRTIFGFDLEELKQAVSRSDMVIIGGGGLFQDYNGFDTLSLFHTTASLRRQPGAIVYYSTPIFIAKTLGKRVVLYGLGIGPFSTLEGHRAAGWISGLADAVTVRDTGSWELLQSVGVKQTVLAADPVVSLGINGSADILISKADIQEARNRKPRIGLNLRRWAYDPDGSARFYKLLTQVAKHTLQQHQAELFIFTFNRSEQEVKLAREFASQFPPDAVTIIPYEDSTPMKLLEFMGTLDLTIAMRLHASIISMAADTPAIGLSYDPKVSQFFSEAGLPGLCIPINEAAQSESVLIAAVDNVLQNRMAWKEKVKAQMAVLRSREKLNRQILLSETEQVRRRKGGGLE
ncbi:polysaccharide pyruvyl transferase family protein [Paenibacillus sp. GCM10012307]|uniref:Polysaccharide pyruvyl transferase family protein n=1 Tax=Paenibacillus roseus TaxID=2798579 RepID=A0A934J7H0_9BACL|nr:polysaccharide pyruvyl transferase family protein [Paenibacillus roseus]MBJ6363048.1 polysaccharide pyruvyl transferase family protein [Paenibacillus roseus]